MEGQKDSRFLKRDEVCALVGISNTELYRRIKHGTFPRQFKIGPKAARWDQGQVRAWMDEQRNRGEAAA